MSNNEELRYSWFSILKRDYFCQMNQVSERKKRIYALQIIKGTIVNQTCRLKLHRQSFKLTNCRNTNTRPSPPSCIHRRTTTHVKVSVKWIRKLPNLPFLSSSQRFHFMSILQHDSLFFKSTRPEDEFKEFEPRLKIKPGLNFT